MEETWYSFKDDTLYVVKKFMTSFKPKPSKPFSTS